MNNKAILNVIQFKVNDVQMCVPLTNVKKVIPLSSVEIVPGAPDYVVGLLNIEGKSTPLIDLSLRCGFPRNNNYKLDIPVLLIAADKKQIAVIVDQVIGLIEMDEGNLQMVDHFNKDSSLFTGSIIYNAESVLLIDIEELLKINLTSEMDNAYQNEI